MTTHRMKRPLEAARTLSLTEAASRFYISQQGLSRQIVSLEKELELCLFDRITRNVHLTRNGEPLLWRWKDTPKEIGDSVDMAREEREWARSRINVAVVGMNGIIEKAGNLLADYMAADPDTEFEISEFTSIRDMTTGNPDLMMMVSFLPTHEQLREKYDVLYIGRLLLYYAVSRKNPPAGKEEVSIEDFRGETMLCLYKNFFAGTEMHLFELLSKQEYVLQKTRFHENIDSLELTLIANEGIHISSKEFYHNYGDRLKLFPLPDAENQVSASVLTVWWKENEKRFENFIKYLKKLCN